MLGLMPSSTEFIKRVTPAISASMVLRFSVATLTTKLLTIKNKIKLKIQIEITQKSWLPTVLI